jgi:predicted transcriptional regulator
MSAPSPSSPAPNPANLSRRERQIMEIVYARSAPPGTGATATEVLQDLPDPPTRTSIRTILRILEGKGHLTHTVEGREFVYQPVAPRTQVGRSALQSVLRAFFANSLPKALAAHFADPRTRLSPEEAQELQQLIEEAKSRGD